MRCPLVSLLIATIGGTHSSLGFVVPPSGRAAIEQQSRYPRPLQYSDVMIEEQKEQLKRRLPPVNRQRMSKLEIEFRELLKDMLYTPQELSSITNPRLRIIYEGVAASYYEQAVYRAFEVLYEDYMPLRIAGRIIHGKLQSIMDKSKSYQQEQINKTMAATGLSLEVVGDCWESFVRIAGDRELDIERVELLVRRGQELELLSMEMENVMSRVNPDGQQTLSFVDLMVAFQSMTTTELSARSWQELFRADAVPASQPMRLDAKREKYSQRYDDMLVKFGEWKNFIPSGEGRRFDILHGCFVGSENEKVVDALRVIYTDYSALRMSGDWIFSVVSTIMNGVMKRRQLNEESSSSSRSPPPQ